jgi:hypothetical protein
MSERQRKGEKKGVNLVVEETMSRKTELRCHGVE